MELPFQRIAEEEATPFQPALEEKVKVVEVFDSKEDFEVFNQIQSLEPLVVDFNHLPPTQVSSVQEAPSVPDTMVLQRKPKTSLLELLESHARGTVHEVAVQTKPPTPPSQTFQLDPIDKKRKRDQKGKDVVEEKMSISPKRN